MGANKLNMPKEIRLYVEKINKKDNEVLLDFIDEKDHLFVVGYIEENIADIRLIRNEYYGYSSMILLCNCSSKRLKQDDVIITINTELFLSTIDYDCVVDDRHPSESRTLLLKYNEGARFANILEYAQIKRPRKKDYMGANEFKSIFGGVYESPFDSYGDYRFQNYIEEFFSDFNGDETSMIVWDVGQGNSNGFATKEKVLLFDFGAPCQATDARVLQYYYSNICQICRRKYGLIISHWDYDHYRQLYLAPESFFNNIELVVFPTRSITVTANKTVERLNKICCNRCVPIVPPVLADRYDYSLAIWRGDFHIYIGASRNDINNSGIFLLVSGEDSYGLFTGDRTLWGGSTSYFLPSRSQKMNVVVPHHGGLCTGNPHKSCINRPHIAAISVGNNTYSHPEKVTIDEYKKIGYQVKRTDTNGNITIPFGKIR